MWNTNTRIIFVEYKHVDIYVWVLFLFKDTWRVREMETGERWDVFGGGEGAAKEVVMVEMWWRP